jgi:hypothetical protein
MRACLDGYKGINLGETPNAQNQAQQQASAQMQQRKPHLRHPCNTLE